MTQPATISADYTLRPSDLAATLALLVEARQPAMVWGPPGSAKSMIAQQVAADGGREYVDIRALLLDPVDLRGIPWRDAADRTRWAPPVFLPPTDDTGLWLINLEELPSCVPMVQAALYQLALERKVGEYELPEGASLIACGNREGDRGVVHRMPTPLASRFVHLEIRVDAEDWLVWGAANGIAPEVLFFVQLEPTLLHQFDPQSNEKAFPCPRTWEFTSNIVHRRNGLDPAVERALFRGTIGEAAAVEFAAFLKVWRELPHPRAVINDPENADIPENASALMALCGSLYRLAKDVNFDAIVTYSTRLRREVGEFLVGSCVRREPGVAALAGRLPLSAGPPPGPSEGSTQDLAHHSLPRRRRALARLRGARTQPRRRPAKARRHPERSPVDRPLARQERPMNLTDDAMQVSLRITAWSGRLYDRQASNHVAVHHDAAASAGRYNKCLLPKAAFAALTATVSACRTAHYENTVPWDDQGSRLLTVANYEHYTELMNGFRERMVRERARFIEDYDVNVDQARLDLGKLFRIEDYPSKEALQDKFSIRYRITPVQDAEQFMAKLATDDVDRVKRDIEHQIEERLHDAVGDLYRRFGEAVERVSERLQEDDNGKPLVFRDSMISNIRDLVDIVPRLNIFGDDELARLCEQVKDKIASIEPDSLRPSKTFDPVARARVKRDADDLMEKFAGYFVTPVEPAREAA